MLSCNDSNDDSEGELDDDVFNQNMKSNKVISAQCSNSISIIDHD